MTAPDKIWLWSRMNNAERQHGEWRDTPDRRAQTYHHQRVLDELVATLHRLAQSIENADLLTDAPNTQKGLMLISAKRDADALIAKHRKGTKPRL